MTARVMNFERNNFSDQPQGKKLPTARLTGIGLAVLCLFLFASLLSYNHAEMGWAFLNPEGYTLAADVPCSNLMGVVGLYAAGIIQALFGAASLYTIILCSIISGILITKPGESHRRRIIALSLMVVCACTVFSLRNWLPQGWVESRSLVSGGGYLGYWISALLLLMQLGDVWAAVIVVAAHGSSLVMFSCISPVVLCKQAWADSKSLYALTCAAIGKLYSAIKNRKQRKQPVYAADPAEQEADWKADYSQQPQPAVQQAPQPVQPQQPMMQQAPQRVQPQPQPMAQQAPQRMQPQPQPMAQQAPQRMQLQPQPMAQQAPQRMQPQPQPVVQQAPQRVQAQPEVQQAPQRATQQWEAPQAQPTIQTAPPPLRQHTPEQQEKQEPTPAPAWQPRRLNDIDAPPLPFEEQMSAAAERKAPQRHAVQQPPTGRARRPQQHFSSGDNLLDLLQPIEESIALRNAPDTDPAASRREQSPVNPGVLQAMNRHLNRNARPIVEDESEEEKNAPGKLVAPPLQVPVRRAHSATLTPTKSSAANVTQLRDTREQQDDYPLPPYDLLNYVPVADEDSEAAAEEMRETQLCIMEALETFKIQVEPGNITRGPSITRYEFYPPKGLKLSKITDLEANLRLAAQAKSIKILAPIPGKNTIGIELENASKTPVYLRELLQSEAFHSKKLRIPVALGKDVYGNPVIGDLAAMPHTLVAGTTGSGKSVCVNSMILSMLYKFRPDELRLILVDPKVVEMQPYKKLPHLACPVVTQAARVIGALRWAVNEMEHRYKLFSKMGVRNFEDFNNRPEDYEPEPDEDEIQEEYNPLPEGYDAADAIVRDIEDSQGEEDLPEEEQGEFDFEDDNRIPAKLPYIVIIIDELADLMMQVKDDLENYIARLTQKARAAGIHLVAATQTPRANVITGIIKANIPSRLAFKVASPLDSRVILDANDAEKLLGKGDFLFLPPGGITKMTRAQGAFVSDPEIAAIVKFCAAHAKQNFVQGVTTEMNNADGSGNTDDSRLGGNGMSDEDAELYTRCVQLVITERKASTSLLQRRFSIGYGRAAKIMDMMEQRGVIGPASGNTSRPREVLVEAP